MQNRTPAADATAPDQPAGRPLDATRPIREQLDTLGPVALEQIAEPFSLETASEYCRRLATSHYENFTVATWLLPAELRRHFCHLYAYCRWADDLADELDDPEQSLRLLDWWERQLRSCGPFGASSDRGGETQPTGASDRVFDRVSEGVSDRVSDRVFDGGDGARHPVFIALGETIREFDLPLQPLAALLDAFRQDQSVTRYETWDELLAYCQRSADPVGRLVLRLGRRASPELERLSDFICTGLQLANFCQDVARDYARGRIYLPRCEWAARGCDERDFAAATAGDNLRAAIESCADRAEACLLAGRPLIGELDGRLRIAVDLFLRGGLDILRAVRRLRYDVLARRPVVGRSRKIWLAVQAVAAAAIAGRTERKLGRPS